MADEESPDRKGHPPAESADGSNLMQAVAENYRQDASGTTVRVKT